MATWAITEAGEVIGMIPVSDGVTADYVARFVAQPSIEGTYVPAQRLTEQQKAVAARD